MMSKFSAVDLLTRGGRFVCLVLPAVFIIWRYNTYLDTHTDSDSFLLLGMCTLTGLSLAMTGLVWSLQPSQPQD